MKNFKHEKLTFGCLISLLLFSLKLSVVLAKRYQATVIYPTNLKSAYYTVPYHPDVIRDYTGEYYYKPLPSQPREKRIRHLKLNQYMWSRRDIDSNTNQVILNYNNWATFYVHNTVDGQFIETAYSPSRQCLSAIGKKGYKLQTDTCNRLNFHEKWKLLPNKYGHYLIQKKGTHLCLQPAYDISFPTLIQMRPCDYYDSQQLWEISDAYLYY